MRVDCARAGPPSVLTDLGYCTCYSPLLCSDLTTGGGGGYQLVWIDSLLHLLLRGSTEQRHTDNGHEGIGNPDACCQENLVVWLFVRREHAES